MRRTLIMLAIALALAVISGASAGGSFDRIVGVGAHGAWHSISLGHSSSGRTDAALAGPTVAVPRGGYVRVYPFVGDLPAVPGRYYVSAHVLCLYWREPVSNCSDLGAAGRRLLSPFERLPLRRNAPTVPIAIRHGSRLLRYANGNIFAALELALERSAIAHPATPSNAVPLVVTWRGPDAAQMPNHLALTPTGAYVSHHLFALPRGPWCYLVENLPHAPVSLLEAGNRVCG